MDDLKTVNAPEWVVSCASKYFDSLYLVQCHPQNFGNFQVVFRFGNYELRIVRDRGDLYVEGRVDPTANWLPPQNWPRCPIDWSNNGKNLERLVELAIANPSCIG